LPCQKEKQMKLNRYDYHGVGENCGPKKAGRSCCGDCYDCYYHDVSERRNGKTYPVKSGAVQIEFDFGQKFRLKPQLVRGRLSK
jgi:hypothetical protein